MLNWFRRRRISFLLSVCSLLTIPGILSYFKYKYLKFHDIFSNHQDYFFITLLIFSSRTSCFLNMILKQWKGHFIFSLPESGLLSPFPQITAVLLLSLLYPWFSMTLNVRVLKHTSEQLLLFLAACDKRLVAKVQTSSLVLKALHFLHQFISPSPYFTLYRNYSLLQFSPYLDCNFLKDGNPVLFLLYLRCLAPRVSSVNIRWITLVGLWECSLNSEWLLVAENWECCIS